MPRDCVERLLDLDTPIVFIHGNGERAVLAIRRGEDPPQVPAAVLATMRWTASQLDEATARVIAAWPSTYRLHLDSLGDVLFCHATPRNDTDIFTVRTPAERLLPLFASANAPIVVCGHTHMQFDRQIGETRVMNAGSVGMPFQSAGAYWLLLGDDVELRRTDYDLADAASRILQTDYPQASEFAEQSVLRPPSSEAMLDSLARAELQMLIA
jgi:diadenosine tetraphosphatase ApaH/serine/threonine PP2A family protein phosphatase